MCLCFLPGTQPAPVFLQHPSPRRPVLSAVPGMHHVITVPTPSPLLWKPNIQSGDRVRSPCAGTQVTAAIWGGERLSTGFRIQAGRAPAPRRLPGAKDIRPVHSSPRLSTWGASSISHGCKTLRAQRTAGARENVFGPLAFTAPEDGTLEPERRKSTGLGVRKLGFAQLPSPLPPYSPFTIRSMLSPVSLSF